MVVISVVFIKFLLILVQLNVSARSTDEQDFCVKGDTAHICGVGPDQSMFGRMRLGSGKDAQKGSEPERRPSFYNYKTLEEFGYKFNKDGEMRSIETGERFLFEVKKGDRTYNQKHYEALGEIITEHVYGLLTTTAGLKKVFVPLDCKKHEGQGFIFMSENALTADKLMVLIHGSGVVRAGQWARSLIINDCLSSGTMLPYISRARKEGYGILITNGNENTEMRDGKMLRIRGSESPERHFIYVWEHFIERAAARDIVIVAHSYGGVVVANGMKVCRNAMSRVKAVAFTDSVHSLGHQGADEKLRTWFRKNTRNWVSSGLPLDSPITSRYGSADCELVSAGTTEHVRTSHRAFNSVFNFLDEKLKHRKMGKTSSGCNANHEVKEERPQGKRHSKEEESPETSEPKLQETSQKEKKILEKEGLPERSETKLQQSEKKDKKVPDKMGIPKSSEAKLQQTERKENTIPEKDEIPEESGTKLQETKENETKDLKEGCSDGMSTNRNDKESPDDKSGKEINRLKEMVLEKALPDGQSGKNAEAEPPQDKGTGESHQLTGKSHQGTGESYQDTGESHQGTGESHPGAGESHQGTVESHQNTGVSHQGTGESHQIIGESHQGTGVSHQGTGESHQGTGESHQGTAESHQGTEESHPGTAESHQGTGESHPGTAESHQGTGGESHQSTGESHHGTGESHQENRKDDTESETEPMDTS